jgi:uncharacterized protein (DUF736 family)
MSEIGRLIPSRSGDLSYLSGHIQTLDGRIPIAIEGEEALFDQQRPSHRITTRARDGSTVDIGAAWLKIARRGPEKGKRFYSIQLDHPERQSALNAAAFLEEKTGDWVIVWRRRGAQFAATV